MLVFPFCGEPGRAFPLPLLHFRRVLVRNLVAARLPARRAVVKTIAAQADVHLPLAGATVLLAIALVFGHVALHAVVPVSGGGGHGRTLARVRERGKFRW